MIIRLKATEHPTADEALQDLDAAAGADHAIQLAGRYFTVSQDVADQLALRGVRFAYLTQHHGQLMTVPVN